MLKKPRGVIGVQILVCVLAIAQLSFFASRKEGFHMDEILTFQLANSYYGPWIVPTQPEGRMAKFLREEVGNGGIGRWWELALDWLQHGEESRISSFTADVYEEPVWISRQQMADYITVDERGGFSCLSVIFNMKNDAHPPLFFMAVHTISALFPGRMAAWMGNVWTIAAVAASCWLMMEMAGEFGRLGGWGEAKGLAAGAVAALWYAGSSGGISTALFIRMYAFLAFFCLWLLARHMPYFFPREEAGDGSGSVGLWDVPLALALCGGFLSQYFFLFFAGILGLISLVWLWRQGDKPRLRRYVCSMAGGGLLSVCLFPFAIPALLFSSRGVEAMEAMGQTLAEYGRRLAVFGRLLTEAVFPPGGLWVWAGACLVLALLRLWRWPGTMAVSGEGDERAGRSRRRQAAFLALVFLPAAGYFLMASRVSPFLINRYIMAIFPPLCLLLVLLPAWLLSSWPVSRFLAALALCALPLAGASLGNYHGEYLYKGYGSQLALAREYGELPALCVYEGLSYYENIQEFALYSRSLLLTGQEWEAKGEDGNPDPVLAGEQALVVLVKRLVSQEAVLEKLKEAYGFDEQSLLLENSVYGDRIWLVRKSRTG